MKVSLVDFVLLILSFFLLIAVILAIVLDHNKKVWHQFDVVLDVVIVDKGRKRTRAQYKRWKSKWQSKNEMRFIVIHKHDGPIALEEPDVVTLKTELDEKDLFISLANFVENTSDRWFLWAGDQVVPHVPIRALTFRSPNSRMLRFFGGKLPDAMIMGVDNEFEFILPVGLFKYNEMLMISSFSDLQLALIHHPEMCYAHIYQELVLVKPEDADKLRERLVNELFQVVHISPRAREIDQLNNILVDVWDPPTT
jgi:hypothetical protein